jgi:hypothetical protein
MAINETPQAVGLIFAQIVALILAGAAVVWGSAALYAVVYPAPSGEWTALAILAAYVVNIPAGLIAMAIGVGVKQGNALLRGICIIVAALALLLPLVVHLVYQGLSRW